MAKVFNTEMCEPMFKKLFSRAMSGRIPSGVGGSMASRQTERSANACGAMNTLQM